MAFRRKRYRRPRRSKWRGRRRPYYWRHRGRHWWWRRRRRFRHRTASVRYYPSRRRKRISVRGWEPLGNICYNSSASSEASPYDDLDTTGVNIFTADEENQLKGKWQGQWGHHFFTLQNLLRRAQYYFNYWSSDWQGYDYVSFKGGWIWLPRFPAFSWMFYLDTSPQSNPKESAPEAKYKFEKTWVHPGILLNRPGAKLLISILQQPYRSLFRRIRVKPPAIWEGNYRIDEALQYLLFHWSWTTVNLSAPFFDYFCSRGGNSEIKDRNTCIQRPWFMGFKKNWDASQTFTNRFAEKEKFKQRKEKIEKQGADTRAVWVDRTVYVKSDCAAQFAPNQVPSNFWNWGPFLPQNVLTGQAYEASIYFRYKLYFKVSGESLYRKPPSKECDGTLFPPAPGGSCAEIQTRSILKKRPLSEADILPGDLDESGMLTERAYERITRPDRGIQSTRLEHITSRVPSPKRIRFREPIGIYRRKRARQLLRILLGRRGEPRGGGPPPNPPPVTEPLDLLLNFPK
nr:ORF1 [Torque teno Leptonychotes weddellii virus 1]